MTPTATPPPQEVKPPPGWYPDPEKPDQLRLWDGSKWTQESHASGTGPREGASTTTAATPPPPTDHPVYVEREKNTMAAVALALGVAGALVGMGMAITYPGALALGGAGLVLGLFAWRRARRIAHRQKMSIAAVLTSLLALGLGVAGAVTVDNAVNDLDKSLNSHEPGGVYGAPPADQPQPAPKPKPQLAVVGDSHTLKLQDDGGKIRVKLVSLTDPVQPYVDPALGEALDTPNPGNRYLGVTLRIRNVGQTIYDDSASNCATLIMANDRRAEDTMLSGGPFGGDDSMKLSPGDVRVVSLPFEAKIGLKPHSFQYTPDSTFGPDTGEWKL